MSRCPQDPLNVQKTTLIAGDGRWIMSDLFVSVMLRGSSDTLSDGRNERYRCRWWSWKRCESQSAQRPLLRLCRHRSWHLRLGQRASSRHEMDDRCQISYRRSGWTRPRHAGNATVSSEWYADRYRRYSQDWREAPIFGREIIKI